MSKNEFVLEIFRPWQAFAILFCVVATYKVIQDIEAEDHLIGPLSFRQFVYALISIFALYLNFILITKHLAFLTIVFLPPALFTGFLAFPFGKDQPTEVWALAKLRYLVKPHRRIWNQSGVKDLVTITAPKKIIRVYTDGLNQNEVQSRLQTLAATIDSRGWATKNVNLSNPQQIFSTINPSDRLVEVESLPRPVPDYSFNPSDDILDEQNNPAAQQMQNLINTASATHHQQLLDSMQGITEAQSSVNNNYPSQSPKYWFAQSATSQDQSPISQMPVDASRSISGPSVDQEQELLRNVEIQNKINQLSYGNLHTIQPVKNISNFIPPASPGSTQIYSDQPINNDMILTNDDQPHIQSVTPQTDAAILNLANNNDLNVATLAREASKAQHSKELLTNEVVISLH